MTYSPDGLTSQHMLSTPQRGGKLKRCVQLIHKLFVVVLSHKALNPRKVVGVVSDIIPIDWQPCANPQMSSALFTQPNCTVGWLQLSTPMAVVNGSCAQDYPRRRENPADKERREHMIRVQRRDLFAIVLKLVSAVLPRRQQPGTVLVGEL